MSNPYCSLSLALSTLMARALICAFVVPTSLQSAVVRIVFEKASLTRPEIAGRGAPVPPSYEALQGKAYGELDPKDPHNAIIQDINLAPRNARGKVEYVATFTLLKPGATAKSSRVLVYEVVNRGASIAPRDYSDGDIFLQSGWQGDIPEGGKTANGTDAETISVPVAHNPDGTSITGAVLARFADIQPGTTTLPVRAAIGYASSGPPPLPVDLDTTHSVLTTRSYEDTRGVFGGGQRIPPGDWAWADCANTPFPGKPDPTHLCVKGGFRTDLLYQLQFTGKDPLVLGIGLAAMRDIASFFRYQSRDEGGTLNPVAGQIDHAFARGISQSGNVLRTFLNLGFNQDEANRQVWDGAMPIIAARQNPVNFRFAIPGGASNLYEPGSDGTVWWSHWQDPLRGNPPAGLLDRCSSTHTCPKIIEVMGSSEFYALRASPDFVGTSAKEDIPLPDQVRRYYVASTQHGGGPGGFHWQPPAPRRAQAAQGPIATAPCLLPSNPNPMAEIERALFARLKAWVVSGTEPPPSKYPKLANGTLVPEAEFARVFPFIPSVPANENIANPTLVYDLGPDFRRNDLSGIIAKEPPPVIGVVPAALPRVDADGNETGGILTVQAQAPLGTYLGWNVVSSGFFKGRFCSLTGSYVPFSATKKERLKLHDPRPSLEERYGDHATYVDRVRAAAGQMVKEGFLLPNDAARMINEAQASDVLARPK